MSVELIGIIALAVAFIGIYRKPSFLVYTFVGATLLGSAAAFILESLGGTSISPAHLVLGFLSLKLLSDKAVSRAAVEQVKPGRPGFWLLVTVIYCVLSAYFMPKFFSGQTYVFPVRNISNVYTVVLEPATSNFTQSVYLVGDFICFFVLAGFASSPEGRKTLGGAIIAAIVLNLIFAVLDLATYATGTAELLSFIRNANYALLSDSEIAGFKRLVGSFNEASSFGAFTLGFFAFTIKLWFLGSRPTLSIILSLLSFGALMLSTSTTAYVGLAVFLSVCYAEIIARAMIRPLTPQMMFFIVAPPILVLIIGLSIALNATSSAYVQDLADTLVLKKMSTDSGVERSAWNRQALQVFLDTYGFGAGNGSLRASSFPLAVLGSLGFIGTTLFSLFFITLFAQKPVAGYDAVDSANRRAAKAACLASLITVTLSGALTDMGLPFFVYAALACSVPVYVPLTLAGEPNRVSKLGYPGRLGVQAPRMMRQFRRFG
jgi:hypothetical protein